MERNDDDLPGLIVTKMTKKRYMADTDTDDDPPIYWDEDKEASYQSKNTKDDAEDNNSNDSKCIRSLKFMLTLTIEPFIFMYMFSYMLHGICSKTLTMEKGCKYELNYTEEICSNLTAYPYEKEEVEKLTNNYSVYSDLIRFIPGTCVVIFTGAWSDKYGRKPPIILSLIGVLLEDIGLILNAIYYEAPLGYMLLASVPSGFTGGFICVISIVYSLATELASERFRAVKFALVGLGMALGMNLGTVAGGILSIYYSYTVIFAIAAIGHGLSIPWVLFAITETRGLDEKIDWKKKFRDIFRIQHVIDGFNASTKKRPNNGRCAVWMLLSSICGIIVTYIALADISFIYTYHRYSWDNAKFSSVSMVFGMLGIFVGVVCITVSMKYLKWSESMLGLIGVLSMLVKNMITAFAAKPWIYYLANSLGLFGGIAPLVVRSIMSKLLHKDELGKVFAFVAACESLVPVVASLMITKLYNSTVEIFPGAAFLLASALLLPAVGTFAWIKYSQPNKYQLLPKSNIQDEDVPKVPQQMKSTIDS